MANISKVIFNSGAFMATAEKLRQYFFCARIPFLRQNTEVQPDRHFQWKRGTQFHDKVIHAKSSDKEAENNPNEISPRSPQTEQYHDLYLESPSLHLGARLNFFENKGIWYTCRN